MRLGAFIKTNRKKVIGYCLLSMTTNFIFIFPGREDYLSIGFNAFMITALIGYYLYNIFMGTLFLKQEINKVCLDLKPYILVNKQNKLAVSRLKIILLLVMIVLTNNLIILGVKGFLSYDYFVYSILAACFTNLLFSISNFKLLYIGYIGEVNVMNFFVFQTLLIAYYENRQILILLIISYIALNLVVYCMTLRWRVKNENLKFKRTV